MVWWYRVVREVGYAAAAAHGRSRGAQQQQQQRVALATARGLATQRQKRMAEAAKKKKQQEEQEGEEQQEEEEQQQQQLPSNQETLNDTNTSTKQSSSSSLWTPAASSSSSSTPSSSSSLIRTDLRAHLEWIESERPTFDDPNKPAPPFHADPSGVVPRDLTQAMIQLEDLYDPRLHHSSIFTSRGNSNSKSKDADVFDPHVYQEATPLSNELTAYISVRGAPITVAEYMRKALTHPVHGYYTNPGTNRLQNNNINDDNDDDAWDNDWDDDDDWDKDDDKEDPNNNNTTTTSSRPSADLLIGPKGDFVTAPEVSQVFGECLCVWFITQWQTLRNNKARQEVALVEVGPGKGTLLVDVLRGALQFSPSDFGTALSTIHLVEASPALRNEQRRRLEQLATEMQEKENGFPLEFDFVDAAEQRSVFAQHDDPPLPATTDVQESGANESSPTLDTAESDHGANESSGNDTKSDDKGVVSSDDDNKKRVIRVEWHDSFASVARALAKSALPTFVICQELVDALPVHVFEKTDKGWRERMVDLAIRHEKQEEEEEAKDEDPSHKGLGKIEEKKPRLCFVLAPDTTPALRTLLNVDTSGKMENDTAQVGDVCEVCPEGILLVQDIAALLAKNGGAALIIDYGQEGSTDSIRAFSKHKQVHVLSHPGTVDVTADVDFGALKHAVNAKREKEEDGPMAFGPVEQGKFLASMGAVQRVVQLIENENTTEEQAQDLYNALERLMLPEHMGKRYKVMAIARKKDGIFEPPGF